MDKRKHEHMHSPAHVSLVNSTSRRKSGQDIKSLQPSLIVQCTHTHTERPVQVAGRVVSARDDKPSAPCSLSQPLWGMPLPACLRRCTGIRPEDSFRTRRHKQVGLALTLLCIVAQVLGMAYKVITDLQNNTKMSVIAFRVSANVGFLALMLAGLTWYFWKKSNALMKYSLIFVGSLSMFAFWFRSGCQVPTSNTFALSYLAIGAFFVLGGTVKEVGLSVLISCSCTATIYGIALDGMLRGQDGTPSWCPVQDGTGDFLASDVLESGLMTLFVQVCQYVAFSIFVRLVLRHEHAMEKDKEFCERILTSVVNMDIAALDALSASAPDGSDVAQQVVKVVAVLRRISAYDPAADACTTDVRSGEDGDHGLDGCGLLIPAAAAAAAAAATPAHRQQGPTGYGRPTSRPDSPANPLRSPQPSTSSSCFEGQIDSLLTLVPAARPQLGRGCSAAASRGVNNSGGLSPEFCGPGSPFRVSLGSSFASASAFWSLNRCPAGAANGDSETFDPFPPLQEGTVTVLVANLAGVHALCAALGPESQAPLGRAMRHMAHAVRSNRGTVVASHCGALVAVFTAAQSPLHAFHACLCALHIRDALQGMCPPCHARTGVHTCSALTGAIETGMGAALGVLGPGVALCASLARLNRRLETSILLTGPLYTIVKTQMVARGVDIVHFTDVRPDQGPVQVHRPAAEG